MCNQYENQTRGPDVARVLAALDLPLVAPPAAASSEVIRPTDPAAIIRPVAGGVELVERRWGFPPARPKAGAVINVRSDRRSFDAGRCLVPATSFFEFTGARSPKTRWRFTLAGADWFCIAGLWRGPADDQRFTLLTTTPGPDIAPYHDRQLVILPRTTWARWLAPEPIPADWLAPLPAGSLTVAEA